MQLARVKRTPERASLLVDEGRPQQKDLTATTDLEQHFLEVYQRLHQRLLNYAECSLSKDDARDACQEAIASLWNRWGSLSLEQRNDKYVFGILRHCVHAKQRENHHLVPLDDAEVEIDRHVIRDDFNQSRLDEVIEVLDAALAAMPARRREVLLLVHEESFAYRQAADILGLRFGTIKTHMYLAMEDLRAAFTKAGFRIADAQLKQLHAPKGGATND